jgi:methyltransferase (TIGR00027 family)
MIEGKASQTAFGAARARAAHQICDRGAIFQDPHALSILGMDEPQLRESLGVFAEIPWWPSVRMLMAARSRFAEDNLRRAVEAGVRQYVVLGAGLDTFSLRNSYARAGLKVFEVDHPDTQAWKRGLLSAQNLDAEAIFTPVDFEHQDLSAELARAGLDFGAPACFAWLGVVMYLTKTAADSTLGLIAAMPEESGVTFDYIAPPASPGQVAFFKSFQGDVERVGEPAAPPTAPEDLAERLHRFGFTDLQDYSNAGLIRHLGARPTAECEDSLFRVMYARKGPRS